jgi:hypothetical protein
MSPKLNKAATHVELLGRDGVRTGRIIVADAKSPTLHTRSPYTRAECYFSGETGEGVVFAHVKEECAAGISQRDLARFDVDMKEKCTFVVVPFQGNYEKALSAYLAPKKDAGPDLSNASSAVVLKRTPELLLWTDHATRKVFPEGAVPPTAPQREEVAIEAAKGEYEPFQVVVTPQKDLADVKVVLAPLTNEKGDRLAVENLRYNPIGSLRSSYDEEIPDLLLQKDAVTCKKGQNNVFWVTVKVPLATPAGTYRGTLALMSKGEKIGDVGVRLKVWDFALSPTPHICAFATDYVAKGISIDESGNGPVLFLADEIPAYTSNHAVVKKTLELARLIKQAEPRAVLVVNGRDVPDDPQVLNLFDLWTARAPAATLAKLRKMGKRYGDYYMHGYFGLRDAAINPRVQFWSYWKYDFFWIGSWAMTMTPDLRWYGSKRNYANNWWFPSMKGRYGEPMSTIRFELMREGLEDHEYLWMLRDQVAKRQAAPEGAANPDLLARAEALLKRAEEVGGNYTSAADEYYFDGYLREPTRLLALRHDIAAALEALAKATPAKAP